jgi:hypothetical protein
MESDKRLWKILIDTIGDETGLAGVPLDVVLRRVKKHAQAADIDVNEAEIQSLIQQGLDEWVIDKTIDELTYQKMRELGLPEESGFIWHLKLPTPEKTEFYRQLRPEARALIRLLREQNDPRSMGIMPRDEAIKNLKEQGFTDDLKYIYAEDTIEDFIANWIGDGNVWCYGLVQEYEKTEEFKKWQEEVTNKAIEREAMRHRRSEEFEITDPIYGHLDNLVMKRQEDLDELSRQGESMSDQDFLLKKVIIEDRDKEEERKWNEVINAVYTLTFDDLIDFQKLFLGKPLPSLDEAFSFLNGIKKKDS